MPQTERPLRSLAIFGLAALAAVLSTAWTRGLTVDPAVGSGIWSWRAFGGNLLLFFGIVLAVTWLATPRRHRLARAPARPDPIGAVPASDPADMSSDLLQALLATSPAGMGLSTFDGKARYVSQNWTDMMGYTLADLPDGNMIHIYDDPADREAYVALLKREGRARNHELRLRRKDGSLLWVILDGTVVNVGGETLIVAWVYDIDALKQRADQIRTVAEQEQRAILDASPMGIAFVADDRMLRCNQMLVTLFGYPDRGALEAVSLAALFSDRADLVRLARRSARRLGKGERYRGEWRLVNADGTTFWADLTAMRLAVPGGTSVTMWMVENVTERKERERRIADREALFGLLLESSPAGLALTTHDGQMRFATEMWKRSCGVDDESFRAIEAGQLYADPADRAAYLEVLQRDGQVIDREIRARHRDGHDFWSRVSSKLVRVGNETLIAAWMQDISWRKERDRLLEEAQTALRVAVDEHRAIFETSSVGIVFLKNRIVIRCNRRLEEIFGYPPGGLDGVPARVWYDSDEAYAEAGKGYATALAGLISVREQRLVRRDGSKFWARVSGRAIDPTDPARGFVSIYEDFTVQREAIEALRIANDEQNAIFKAATSGIALIKDRIIGSCNRQLEALFGYGPGEFRGKPTRLWYATDEEHAAIGREIRIDFGRGEAHRSERQVIRKDGTPFWCRFSGRLLDPAEPDRGAVWMVEDVTDEREAAAALLRAKELAEQATREKSMFLANMSHEIRTPMNAIIGLSHLALQTELTARQRDYVKKVHDAGTSLLGIVNDILDFSKVEAGKLDVESTRFVLDQMLDRVSSLVAQRAYDKGLELLFDVAPDVPQGLLGDPLRLGQVLINLVGNAIKFTERGQIEVRVRTLALVGDRVDLHFEVHDTGIGMSEDQSARLFRAFTQVDGSATRKYGGTGLGLTISKRLVELMGGRIGVQSVSGQGSTFAFNVQLGIDEHVAVRQRVLPKELNGMRVLVADDNAAAREILSEQLRVLSFDVSAVESGATALQALRDADRDGPFGALFLDWKMPGMDGVETARRMGTDPPLRHPPRVIMVTAFAHEEVRTEAEAAGIHAFLSKPVGRSALVDTLVGLFAPQHGTVAAQAMPLSATRPDLTGVRVL
ncbi:MAG: PAS domain S-box protein, partial [Burkholderiales bacterium]|nr:PAS domain S-box protein [Burkholderiales bacterium]